MPSALILKFRKAMLANPNLMQELNAKMKPGQPLEYDERLGLTRLDEVAGSSNELTGYRRSGSSALEAQGGGTSRGPLCDRFGWKEIPGVRARPRWTVAVRGAVRNAVAAGLLAATAAVAGDPGDGCRGIPHRRCCEECRARGESGAGDAGGRPSPANGSVVLFPDMGPTRALVNWEIDGKSLSPEEAPFRLVVTTDKEPSRSLYKLVRLEVVDLRSR